MKHTYEKVEYQNVKQNFKNLENEKQLYWIFMQLKSCICIIFKKYGCLYNYCATNGV